MFSLPDHRGPGCRDGVCGDTGMHGVPGRSHTVPELERVLGGPKKLPCLVQKRPGISS